MNRSAALVLALVLGAVLANTLLPENGYVAISFRGYLAEMSVPTFVCVVLLTLLLVALLVRLLRVPRLLRAARREQRRRRARESLARALLEMAAGDYAASESTATRSVHEASQPAAHYLLAARAADLQGARVRAAEWLALARAAADDAPAVLVTEAELAVKAGAADVALAALKALAARGSLSPRALILLARVHRTRGDFAELKRLESTLRATRGIAPQAVDEIMDALYLDMLKVATDKGGLAAVEAVWEEASRAARREPPIVLAYARALAKFAAAPRAVALLEQLLAREWFEPAVLLYGELEAGDPVERLAVAETWLRARREDALLLVTCARLCLRAELYGKARSYLETSYALRPRAETAQLLAGLLEQLGDRERARELLHQALAASLGRQAELPRVRARRFGVPRR